VCKETPKTHRISQFSRFYWHFIGTAADRKSPVCHPEPRISEDRAQLPGGWAERISRSSAPNERAKNGQNHWAAAHFANVSRLVEEVGIVAMPGADAKDTRFFLASQTLTSAFSSTMPRTRPE
jgi:hypothetical protein